MATLSGVGVAAILLAFTGLAAAYDVWKRTRTEGPGDHHAALTSGAGRTRFLGLCGLVASTIFIVATVFEMLVPFLAMPCGT